MELSYTDRDEVIYFNEFKFKGLFDYFTSLAHFISGVIHSE